MFFQLYFQFFIFGFTLKSEKKVSEAHFMYLVFEKCFKATYFLFSGYNLKVEASIRTFVQYLEWCLDRNLKNISFHYLSIQK